MEKYYSTGTFAKMAKVTERTIRYYDKIGLLKPSFIMVNGYRRYSYKDFLILQKIISLKHLGFPIEEIFPLIANENDGNIKKSLEMQIELVSKRIVHLQSLKEALHTTSKNIDGKNFDWNKIIELVQLTNMEDSIVEQYRNSSNLNIRISLHEKYSINKQGWFPWVYNHIDFNEVYRLLEVGCGNGKLWSSNNGNLRNREVFLSGSSEGMIEDVRKKLGKEFNCIVADCESIPFKNEYFDTIIANHVLFHVRDIDAGLKEIERSLRGEGIFYCTTYAFNHMKEISDLVKRFDCRIVLSETQLYEKFGLDNGEYILKKYFKDVKRFDYPDKLIINKAQPLVDYIMSCHGNQNEIIGKKMKDFKKFIADNIKENGNIEITKNAGLFICKKQ